MQTFQNINRLGPKNFIRYTVIKNPLNLPYRMTSHTYYKGFTYRIRVK
ncbi:hypothetical protein ACHAXS_001914 [Conticribra weissflogii]